jgi:alcohol/geraniol dehydrogenase (NADP+)
MIVDSFGRCGAGRQVQIVVCKVTIAQKVPGVQRAGLGGHRKGELTQARGHLAIQFLHEMGHDVTGFSHWSGKRELIERLGEAFADSADAARHEGAFDFILSTLNVAFDLDSYVRMLDPQGQLCLVASPLQALSLSGGLLNDSGRSIYGNYKVVVGIPRRCSSLPRSMASRPLVDVMPFARVNEAIGRVRSREVRMGLVSEKARSP